MSVHFIVLDEAGDVVCDGKDIHELKDNLAEICEERFYDKDVDIIEEYLIYELVEDTTIKVNRKFNVDIQI